MSSSKHFINDPTHLVNTALESITLTNPAVALDKTNKIIYRRPSGPHASSQPPQVSIISGGGSGHEPSFAAMVGRGLLSAAVVGTIFASPSAEQIRVAIMSRVDHSRGVLMIVMNYTGDVLNFGLAVEKVRVAAHVPVEMVVVADDVGVGRLRSAKVGRRGIAGTVLVHKISAALAAQGYGLDDVVRIASLTAANLVSVGASLEHVHVPGRALPWLHDAERLDENQVEIGMGIHNEVGSGRLEVELPQLVGTMLKQLLDQTDEDRAFLHVNSNEVVLMVNNLGGVSVLELGGITTEVVKQLDKEYSIRPVRILSGTYMTSLNGLGFSISLLNVVNTDIGGPSMLQLLDYPCEATGWAAPISKETWEEKNERTREEASVSGGAAAPSGLMYDAGNGMRALQAGLEYVIGAESEITMYASVVGDGDCGVGLKRGAEAILHHLKEKPLSGDAALDVATIVPIVEMAMDGTSGALYAIFLNALVHGLHKLAPGAASPKVWAAALRHSCEVLSRYTPARPGDRTLVDALYPFVNTLAESGDLQKAAEVSKAAAEATRGIVARLGRAVYVGGSNFKHVPDPGAWGLACFFLGIAGLAEEGWEAV